MFLRPIGESGWTRPDVVLQMFRVEVWGETCVREPAVLTAPVGDSEQQPGEKQVRIDRSPFVKHRSGALVALAALVVAAGVGGLVGGGAAIALVRSSYNGPVQTHGRPEVAVHSEVLGESILLRVQVPVEYGSPPDRRFPVLWVLDGPAAGGSVHDANQTLSRIGAVEPAIVVSVPHSSAGRSTDFRPPQAGLDEAGGGADRLLEFLAREAMPTIQREYMTNSVAVLIGHSLGGLFVLYAFGKRPDLFDGWVAFSPSVWVADEVILRILDGTLRRPGMHGGFLFVSVGAEEGGRMLSGTRAVRSVLEDAAPSGLDWHVEVTPGADHSTNPKLSFPEAVTRFWQF